MSIHSLWYYLSYCSSTSGLLRYLVLGKWGEGAYLYFVTSWEGRISIALRGQVNEGFHWFVAEEESMKMLLRGRQKGANHGMRKGAGHIHRR
jgi:hypothetical protein